jgi:hypothetical protein
MAAVIRDGARLLVALACFYAIAAQAQTPQNPLKGGVTQNVYQGPVPGDVFSSNGGSPGRGTFPTGTQSHQPNDGPCANPFGCGRGTNLNGGTAYPAGRDVYCQQSPGMPMYGPYSHTGTQTPCGPNFGGQVNQPNYPPQPQPPQPPPPKQPPAQKPTPVFHFYYINGMNTPLDTKPRMGPNNPFSQDPCGDYVCEYGYVKQQLAENPATKVAGERSRMEGYTHNPSSQDPVMQNLVGTCNGSNGPIDAAVKQIACWIDQVRKLGGISWGDFAECLAQSLKTPFTGAVVSANEIEAINVSDKIINIYNGETKSGGSPKEINYFIIVGHSQGNFLTEGVVYRLLHPPGAAGPNPPGPYIARNRVGVLSLGSPTRYDSLPDDFIQNQLKHVTRKDDGIHILDFLSAQGVLSKRPWDRGEDAPALWPWPTPRLDVFFSTLPGFMEAAGYIFTSGLPALATPLMNAHLLENYLTNPTATPQVLTPPERELPADIMSKMLLSGKNQTPVGVPILNIVQQKVRDLKNYLLAKSPPTAKNTQPQQASASSPDGWSPPQ